MVEVEPPAFTASGKRRRKLVREVIEYRDVLDGHGAGIGMWGEWSL